MHLVPSGAHVLEGERVCLAVSAIAGDVEAVATRHAVLADPTRLRLLLAIRAASPIAVTDLAAATGVNESTVSQALRHLRASGTVRATRQGRVMAYALADPEVEAMLGPPSAPPHGHTRRRGAQTSA